MKLLRKQAYLPPITLFVSKMDEACPSMAFSQQTINDPLFLIVGTSNGEAIFYPINNQNNQSTTKFVSDNKSPVTAIAEGCLRDPKIKEVIVIHANGLMHSLDYPKELDGPLKIFSQQIYANVNACRILDIDGDKISELLVMLTDRVVRSYRYHEDTDRLVPLNKWEMPSHIAGWCLGFNGHYYYLLLSQCDQSQYVTIDFGPTKDVKVQNSIINDNGQKTQIVIAPRPQAADLSHCLAERIIIANLECRTESELRDIRMDICCAGALTLENGLSMLVTIDPKGQMLIFGWTKDMPQTTEPLAKCSVLSHPVYLTVYPFGQTNPLAICVSVIDVSNRIAVYFIDLIHVVSL